MSFISLYICIIVMQVKKEVRCFGGIQNKENSCWLIAILQLINATDINQFLCGEWTTYTLLL